MWFTVTYIILWIIRICIWFIYDCIYNRIYICIHIEMICCIKLWKLLLKPGGITILSCGLLLGYLPGKGSKRKMATHKEKTCIIYPGSRGPLLLGSSELLWTRTSKVHPRQYFTTITFGVPDPKRNDHSGSQILLLLAYLSGWPWPQYDIYIYNIMIYPKSVNSTGQNFLKWNCWVLQLLWLGYPIGLMFASD